MTKRFALIIACSLITLPANAHDFWIEPEAYTVEVETPVALNIYTGHGEDKAAWPIAPHRVVGLRSQGPEGLASHVSEPASLREDITLTFGTEGLHMVFIESTNSYSRLPADRFEDYVAEEGVLPIAAHRLASGQEDREGTELYSRRGKALVQAGCDAPDEAIWSKALGLSLEVIPQSNPFRWDAGEPFSVEVRFHGQPLSSATLHVSQLDGDRRSFSAKTDMTGQADLGDDLSEGRWLVHTVWSEPASGLLLEADYQTVFSSFTFETAVTGCP